MANYTKGKGVDVNDLTLADVRTQALLCCQHAEEIVIIGVKPYRDRLEDSFVADLLGTEFPKMTYVSKCKQECMLIGTLHRHARTNPHGLRNFLRT